MEPKLARAPSTATAIGLSLIFTLYLAPSKYMIGDILAAILLLGFVVVRGARQSGVIDGVKHLAPLLLLLLYVIGFDVIHRQSSNLPYASELLAGFLPFLLLYVISRAANPAHFKILVVGVFVLPGLVHLGYMWLDIFAALAEGKLHFLSSSKHGLLEEVKNLPRVGRRYLSIVLVHMLFGCVLLAKVSCHSSWKRGAYGLAALAVLSLGLLDARAAYVSVGLGMVLVILFVLRNRAAAILQNAGHISLTSKLLAIAIIFLMLFLAYEAGKSRWVAMSYSFHAAINDVLTSDGDVSARPYVDKAFWDQPVADPEKCFLEGRFRCRADQSAYLRLAWVMEGLSSLVDHPFGLGYSENYMGRLWGVEGDESKFQRTDSSLGEHVVWFGVVGVVFYCYFGWAVVTSARRALKTTGGTQALVVALMATLIFVVGVRGIFDLITEGAWRYLMALIGLYYGTLHSISVNDALYVGSRRG